MQKDCSLCTTGTFRSNSALKRRRRPLLSSLRPHETGRLRSAVVVLTAFGSYDIEARRKMVWWQLYTLRVDTQLERLFVPCEHRAQIRLLKHLINWLSRQSEIGVRIFRRRLRAVL